MTEPALSPMFVLDRRKDGRLHHLDHLERYYEGRQHDHYALTWWNHNRVAGANYLWEKFGSLGAEEERAGSIGERRPCVAAGTAGLIVGSFTEMVGCPSISVAGDDDASEYLQECLREINHASTTQRFRDATGSVGSAAVVVSIDDGRPMVQVIRSRDIFVERWANQRRWIPEDVVYQRLCLVERREGNGNKVTTVKVWKTTRWTSTHTYEYEDVPEHHDPETPLQVADGWPRPHGAGRCPVVWAQNTEDHDSQEGEYDLINEGNLELSDRCDQMWSTTFRSAASNTEPTYWEADRLTLAHLFPNMAKGAGEKIRLTEEGRVGYLEVSGEAVKSGRDLAREIRAMLQENTRCVIPTPEMLGSLKSGSAIERLMARMVTRVLKLRSEVEKTWRQVCKILLSMGRHFGVSMEDAVAGDTIVLPARRVMVESDEEATDRLEREYAFTPHSPGTSSAVKVVWPPVRKLSADELAALANALNIGLAAKFISQETAIEQMSAAMGEVDAEQEKRRIHEEQEVKDRKAMEIAGAGLANVQGAAGLADGEEQEGEPQAAGRRGVMIGRTGSGYKGATTPRVACRGDAASG